MRRVSTSSKTNLKKDPDSHTSKPETFRPQPPNLGSSSIKNNRSKKVEVIVLSDSEETDSTATLEANPVKNSSGNIPRTPTSDIDSFYRSRGLSLSHVRRLNRNYIRDDGVGGNKATEGLVYWDSYSPPPGFKDVELPPLENSQNDIRDEPVSPAILNAERYKMKPRIHQILNSEDDFQDLLRKFTKRRATENDNKENPSKRSTPEYSNGNNIVTTPKLPATVASNSLNISANTSFPEGDLNDSAMLRCTQAAELAFSNNNNLITASFSKESNKSHLQKEFNSEPDYDGGPICASTPLNSFRHHNGLSNKADPPLTPKTGILNSWRSRQMGTPEEISASSSVFESSNSASSRSSRRNGTTSSIPRISLFGKNENVISTTPVRVGVFEDDDDDDIFSQMDLPSGDDNNKIHQRNENFSNETVNIHDATTGSTFSTSLLAKIDRLEEMALLSGSRQELPTLRADLERSSIIERQLKHTGKLTRMRSSLTKTNNRSRDK